MSTFLPFVLAAGLLAPAAPPFIPPIIEIQFDVQEGKPDHVLAVFDGQYLRADWIDKKTGKVDQRFWSQDEGRKFGEFLKSLKLSPRGRSAVTSDSEEGKKLLEKIDELVVRAKK